VIIKGKEVYYLEENLFLILKEEFDLDLKKDLNINILHIVFYMHIF